MEWIKQYKFKLLTLHQPVYEHLLKVKTIKESENLEDVESLKIVLLAGYTPN